MNILGIKLKGGAYTSDLHAMHVGTLENEFYKEFEKTYYITDKKLKLQRVQELIDKRSELKAPFNMPELPKWDKLGFDSLEAFREASNESMFYNQIISTATKRQLEIEVYVTDILNKAEAIAETNIFKAICYLIDEQYKFHTSVLKEPLDVMYQGQYNALIYDIIQLKIRALNNAPIQDIQADVTTAIKKSLKWNSTTISLGTLFGVLFKEGIISGTKADLSRALSVMFDLKQSTLLNSIKLHSNINEAKTYYDPSTVELTKDWISHLK